jgi:hypothetical protein
VLLRIRMLFPHRLVIQSGAKLLIWFQFSWIYSRITIYNMIVNTVLYKSSFVRYVIQSFVIGFIFTKQLFPILVDKGIHPVSER